MKFYVHDYLIEETDFSRTEGAFLYHFSILCSLNQTYREEEIERFSISVGNSTGVQSYLDRFMHIYKENNKQSFFISDKFFVTDSYDEEKVINEMKEIIKSLSARNEKLLRIKMMMTFCWEYESYPEICEKYFD